MRKPIRVFLHICLAYALLLSAIPPTIYAQQSRRPLPNTIERRRPARDYRPFTLADFQQVRPNIRSITRVPLPNGSSVPLSQYLVLINQYERLLNNYGYTLRDQTPQPVILDETRIQGRDTFRTTQGSLRALSPSLEVSAPSFDGPLSQFTPYEENWTILDPAIFGVQLVRQSSSTNQPTTIEATDKLLLDGVVFNHRINLITANTLAIVPTSMASDNQLRRARVSLNALSLSVINKPGEASGQDEFLASDSVSKSLDSDKLRYKTFIGPIPITFEVGFNVNYEMKLTSRAAINATFNEGNNSGSVRVIARALADALIVRAGLESVLEILSFTYTHNSTSTLKKRATIQTPEPPWNFTSIEWQYGSGYKIGSGAGELLVVIEVDLWILGSRRFAKKIVSWNGYTWEKESEISPVQTLWRPAACGAPPSRNANCTGLSGSNGCVNLSADSQNCGGCGVVCPSGRTCQAGKCVRRDSSTTCPPPARCCGEFNPETNRCVGKCIGRNQVCP